MFIILTYQYDAPDITGSWVPENWVVGCDPKLGLKLVM